MGDPAVRDFNTLFQAFDSNLVFGLIALLTVQFITGVTIALRDNVFEWEKTFDIAKKNLVIAVAWGAAFVYSENAGNIVYTLAMTMVGGSVLTNIMELLDVKKTGIVGQLLAKGPGDGSG